MKAYIVDTAALEHNIQTLLAKAGDTTLWGVVKGNGYGLGCVEMAGLLAKNGVDHFAVTDVGEVRALREAGFRENPILMMENTACEAEINELLDLDAILSIGSDGDARAVNAAAAQRACVAQAHVKIDTGMGRFGFLPEQAEQILGLYKGCDSIAFTGIYTHFLNSGDAAVTQSQFDKFMAVVEKIRQSGYETGMVHCCNSTAFWKYPQMHCDGVRIGSALLGRVGYSGQAGLKKIGYCRALVEQVRTIPAGHTVGYGGGWKAKREAQIAVIPVGYFHGFAVDRGYDLWRWQDCLRGILRYIKALLQKKALYVSIGGKNCRVLGHVGMVNLVADVTGLEVKPNDEAIVEINPLLIKGVEVVFE